MPDDVPGLVAPAGGLLPSAVEAELRRRWAEPHRHYHSTTHLVSGLAALDLLGAGDVERIAFWFHDAVHSNRTPADEEASAALAGELLAGSLEPEVVREVGRLVMLTAHHLPAPDDAAGARLCDADLSAMGADRDEYLVNVAGIRSELPGLTDEQWRLGRGAFLERFLQRDRLFHTPTGRGLWERRARSNMQGELETLR